jgi:hypothetical protein
MPVVPRYEQGQVRQQVAPTPQISRAPSAAFGGEVGAALGNVAGVLGQVAEQERNRMDTAAVMEAEAELRTLQNGMLFGENGAYRTKGKDSFGLPERVLPEYDKSRDRIAMNLRGRQKELFEQRTAGWRPQMEGDMMRYVARESETYTANTTKAYIESAGQTALLYYNDPAKVDGEIARAQDAYIVGNPGEPPEATANAMRQIDSTIRKSIVDRLMTESPVAAEAYYRQNSAAFTGSDQAQIERVLKPLVKENQGEAIGKAALAGSAVIGAGGDYTAYRRTLESGGNPNAKNPNSSATGIDQFTAGTWMGVVESSKPQWAQGLSRDEILKMRRDPVKSGEMATELDRQNAAALAKAGQPATNENLYAAHHFGAAAGVKFAQASGDTPVSQILSSDAIKANPYLRGMTKQELLQNWNARTMSVGGQAAGGAPRSYADAKQYVLDNVQDPEVRKSAIAYINMQDDLAKQREQETDKAMIESINSKVEQAAPSTPFAKIVTPQELAWAQESGRVGAWEDRMRARVTGTDTDTAPDLLLAYRDVAYKAAKGDTVAKRELASYKPYDPKLRMSQSDRDWLAKAQADVASGDPAKIAGTATEGEMNAVIKQYSIQALGVPEKQIGKNTEAGQRAWQFQNDLRSWADQFERDHKRKPSYKEVVEQADLMTLNNLEFTYTEPGILWDSDETATVADLSIPPEAQAQIVQALRTEGKAVTGANVAAKWQAYLAKRGAQ